MQLAASSICWAEFLCGPFDTSHVEHLQQILGIPVPFTAEDSALAANLFKVSGRRPGSFVDCMIAATAIREKATLATANLSDFNKFQSSGLTLEKVQV